MSGLTPTQVDALARLANGPQKRGLFLSGWGPRQFGHGCNRVDIREATANKLISLGLAERYEVEGDPRAATLIITADGIDALCAERAKATGKTEGERVR